MFLRSLAIISRSLAIEKNNSCPFRGSVRMSMESVKKDRHNVFIIKWRIKAHCI